MDSELRIVAKSVAAMLAKTVGATEPEPELQSADAGLLAMQAALSGDIVQFTVPTLFGFDARVTITRAGGMFDS